MANTNDCGYWTYSGSSGSHPEPEEPRVLTRAEKGQALTHLEMDINLTSLLHKAVTSSVGSSFAGSESSEENDIFFERHKPTREEEMAGLFATFSYAALMNGEEVELQYPDIMIKVQHTTDEIRYKLSNEVIPGTLGVQENLYVTGNLNVAHDTDTDTLNVRTTATVADLRVSGSTSIDGDVYIIGNLYVNGVLFGNLSQEEYNSLHNPNYALEYKQWGTMGTGSAKAEGETETTRRLSALEERLRALEDRLNG